MRLRRLGGGGGFAQRPLGMTELRAVAALNGKGVDLVGARLQAPMVELLDAHPVAALVAAGEKVDLLVIGSRGLPRAPARRLPLNRWLLGSVAGSAALVAAAVYLPVAHEPFATTSLGAWPATTVGALALARVALVELSKKLARVDTADVATKPAPTTLAEGTTNRRLQR